MIIIILYNTKIRLSFSGDSYRYRATLWQYFSFLHPKRNFIKSFKEGTWDGTISMLSKTNELMAGFLPTLITLLKDLQVSYKIIDERIKKFNFAEFPNVPQERQYQLDAVKAIANSNVGGIPFYRGIISAATNSGKSYIMSYLLESCTAKKVLFLVSSRVVPVQMKELFGRTTTVGDFGEDVRVTVATPKKLLNQLESSKNAQNLAKEYDLILIDESHKAASPTYIKLLKYFDPYGMLYFSATALDVPDVSAKLYLIGSSGNVLYNIKNTDVVEKKLSLKPVVRFIDIAAINVDSYPKSYEINIINNDTMHQAILSECLLSDKVTMIVVQYLDHASQIQDYFKSNGFYIPIISGDDFDESVYKDFVDGKVQWIISTFVIKEGANLPIVQKQIHAFGGKSDITVTQIVGRGQRLMEGATDRELEIVDFKFDVRYLKAHYKKRVSIYKNIGAEIVNEKQMALAN